MVLLSPHFSYAEMTFTQQRGHDNRPTGAALDNLRHTAESMEEVRDLFDCPIHINSGYRSPGVNALVGGAVNSAHMAGDAVDFVIPQVGTPYEVALRIAVSQIEFDQLIYEYGAWVHLSFAATMRRQILTKHTGSRPIVSGIILTPLVG